MFILFFVLGLGVFGFLFKELLIGFFAMVIIINISGKGNLAPSSATDQVLNYVLGGIVGGVIYNPGISILQYFVFFSSIFLV